MSLGFDPSSDYYADLGLKSNCTETDVKKAFRKLAAEHHPDKNEGRQESVDRFNKINAAYQVLNDRVKRSQYDNIRNVGSNPFSSFNTYHTHTNHGYGRRQASVNINLDDIFRNFYDSSSVKNQDTSANVESEEGEDIEITLEVSLEQAHSGCKKELTVNSGKIDKCDECKGTGGDKNALAFICSSCGGIGSRLRLGYGKIPCGSCKGTGHSYNRKCKACDGFGKKPSSRNITVTIPPGVDTGSRLRISGQGTPGVNLGPGDLFINIKLIPHAKFRRDGLHLYSEESIPFHHLLSGKNLSIETINGEVVNVPVPENLSDMGMTLVVPGKGMESPMRRVSGDLFVSIIMTLPKKLSEKAKILAAQLATEIDNSKF